MPFFKEKKFSFSPSTTHESSEEEEGSLSLHFTSLHFTSLHFTSLHFTSLHFTSLHFTSLHFTSLHFTSLHFTSLHFTSLHFTSLHFTSLHFTSLHFTSLHFTSLHFTSLHFTSLHFTSLHFTSLHFTSLHFTSLHFTSLHFTSLHFTSLHFTSLHFTSLHFTSLHFTSLHFTSLHFTSLHFTSLHFTSLHFTSLHCSPFHRTSNYFVNLLAGFSFAPEDLRRYEKKRRAKLQRRPKTPFHAKNRTVSKTSKPRAKPRPGDEPKPEDQVAKPIPSPVPDCSSERNDSKFVTFDIPLEGTTVRPPTSRPNTRRQMRPKTPRADAGELALRQANAQKRREDAMRSRARGLGKRGQVPGTRQKDVQEVQVEELLNKVGKKMDTYGDNRKKKIENIVIKQADHFDRIQKQVCRKTPCL